MRLNQLLKCFKDAIARYQNALNNSTFKINLNRLRIKTHKKKTARTMKTVYFNPPYCKQVKNNIRKAFLKLTDKHDLKLNKIINRSNCRISYSCINSILKESKNLNENSLKTKKM